MRFSTLSGAVLAAPLVAAFPLDSPAWETILKSSLEKRQLPASPPPFDAKAQLVSTSGQYAVYAITSLLCRANANRDEVCCSGPK